jgi:hypothetical protein
MKKLFSIKWLILSFVLAFVMSPVMLDLSSFSINSQSAFARGGGGNGGGDQGEHAQGEHANN